MLSTEEKSYCSLCDNITQHYVVLVRKQHKKHEKDAESFWKGFFAGWFLGPFIASMDEFERHSICSVCGMKKVED
ncbi:hypothetical protein BIZ37_26750 [Photobacterium sp. BZF1]|uniref:hypothetical protein n=1 Tax=Photobacterium sp. BZF1 TaxID=1904457 RepID=UPI001653878C|nr:hypothetical protein [Photobacterium sp. BZF1]MBC7006165.1 hypothetical protein [Photobacterium sp. BZF1]